MKVKEQRNSAKKASRGNPNGGRRNTGTRKVGTGRHTSESPQPHAHGRIANAQGHTRPPLWVNREPGQPMVTQLQIATGKRITQNRSTTYMKIDSRVSCHNEGIARHSLDASAEGLAKLVWAAELNLRAEQLHLQLPHMQRSMNAPCILRARDAACSSGKHRLHGCRLTEPLSLPPSSAK